MSPWSGTILGINLFTHGLNHTAVTSLAQEPIFLIFGVTRGREIVAIALGDANQR